MIDLARYRWLCWDDGSIHSRIRSPHAASGRLLFFVSVPVGLYRAQSVCRDCENPPSQGKLKAGGAGRSVFGNRRPAADEASSGTATLPDGRTAALARQARAEIPSAAGELAVQRAAGPRRGDRG